MKIIKLIFLFTIVFIIIFLSLSENTYAQNNSNGGFELGTTEGWSIWKGGNSSVVFTAETTVVASGKYACEVSSPNNQNYIGITEDITDIVQTNGSGNYVLKAKHLYGQGFASAGKVDIVLDYTDGNGAHNNIYFFGTANAGTEGTNKWISNEGTKDIAVTGNVTSADIRVYTYSGNGQVPFYVDDIDLRKSGIQDTITAGSGPNGNISPNGKVLVSQGTDQNFKITPDSGYVIDSVIVDGISKGAISNYKFSNVQKNHSIFAYFTVAKQFIISADAGINGKIVPSGSVSVLQGGNQLFNIIPDSGYVVNEVMVDSISSGSPIEYKFNNIQKNHSIYASFKLAEQYTITAASDSNGKINPSGIVHVLQGTNKTFTIYPDSGYVISDIFLDGKSIGAVNNYTFYNLQMNHTIYAKFKIAPPNLVKVFHGVSGVTGIRKSSKYQVTLIQDSSYTDSFVYQDSSQVPNFNPESNFNHFTVFDFSGSVTIRITKLDGNIQTCTVYPLNRGILANLSGNTATFTIHKPEKLFVKIRTQDDINTINRNGNEYQTESYNNPLFIFADSMETNIPDTTSPDVYVVSPSSKIDSGFKQSTIYFKPGVYNNLHLDYPVYSNKTYYLAGGAFINATFLGNAPNNVNIKGRGILCGRNWPNMPYGQYKFKGCAIMLGFGNTNVNYIEGITILDPAEYCMQSYGGKLITKNVNCMAWYYETDGWVGGDGSVLENCFFKVNDDVVKLYFGNYTINNLVIYHQNNGAPFQINWGADHAGSNGTITNVDVVQDDAIYGLNPPNSNRSFLNGANNTVLFHDFTFKNINYDQNISQVIAIKGNGSVKNITFQNFTVNGKQVAPSYLNGGTIQNINFINLKLNRNYVTEGSQIDLQTEGSVSGINFLVSDSIENTVKNSILPRSFSLEQNFPNPFNPSTIIQYSIKKQAYVKLLVYNILGQKVALLVNKLQKPGIYNVTFKAIKLASGIYFYMLDAGNFRNIKKMMILK